MTALLVLGHVSTHGVLAFVLPVILVVVWAKLREWRQRRNQTVFAEFLVLSRCGDRWTIVEATPDETGPQRKRAPSRAPWRPR